MTFHPANFDPSIDPTADQVRALRDAGPDGPVVMLNLLKFREQANYPAGSPHAPCSGAEAYRRYQTAFVETVGDVSRAEVVWEGRIDRPFIGDASQDWRNLPAFMRRVQELHPGDVPADWEERIATVRKVWALLGGPSMCYVHQQLTSKIRAFVRDMPIADRAHLS